MKRQIDSITLCWLMAAIILTILPHGLRMAPWVLPLTLILILWRLGGEFRHWPLPGPDFKLLRLMQLVLMAAACVGVYISFHTLAGREAGSALLVLLAGFKLLEVRQERDFYVAIFLGFFIMITNFLVTETISTALYMLFSLLIMFTALIMFNDQPRSLSYPEKIRRAGKLILQGLPLMLVLFVLFPRINGPLWGLPQDAHAGLMGIDDTMAPGSISKLIQSNEVAFRVEFKGTPPANNKLYWRGPVLWFNDGKQWSRERVTDTQPAAVEVAGEAVQYSITLEPTNQRWLFAMEMAQQPSGNGYFSNDYQLRVREPVRKRIRYDLVSYPQYRLGHSNDAELQRALQLPIDAHVQTIALVKQWQEEAPSPDNIIQRALRMFNQENFFYTLTPQLLNGDPVDDFLFRTREGFCEHYASAFTVMMRAAGIPARVVAGYQGGRFNPVGDYFIVYQRDAHAWAEVWLKDRGWVRVDPTSAVAPERVEQGIIDALPDAIADVPVVFGQMQFSRNLWQNLRDIWDAANNQWIQWVITYNPERQASLLKKLGINSVNLQLLGAVVLGMVTLTFVLISVWLLQGYRPSRDPARDLYDHFCEKLGHLGTRRLPYEGPLDFARRAGLRHHNLAGLIDEITRLYISVRYGSQQDKLSLLKRQVTAFKPEASTGAIVP